MERFSFYQVLTLMALRQSSIPLEVTVQLEQGTVQGIELTSVQDNERYVGFLGIPYAKPPVDMLRFKAPQPPDPWKGTLYATRNAAECPQKFPFSPTIKVTGEENCLFLNVYTQHLPVDSNDHRPVMVWIHGGAFEYGSGDKKMYGPDYLVLRDVVVVTMNYRLGALGFLSTQDSAAPGNNGLKDQVAALRWVKKNIALFGGNPQQVTIFGESAGAASVQFHMMSPMSRGLFHRAISQSGSALNPWGFNPNARTIAFRFARTFGCNSTDSHQMVDCLRLLTTREIADINVRKLATPSEEMEGRVTLFVPTSEEGVKAGDGVRFLLKDPASLMASGKFQKVPHIMGVNSHEAIILARVFATTQVLGILEENFDSLVPQDLLNQESQRSEISRRIKQFYFQGKNITKNTTLNLVNMMTDLWFTRGIRQTVQIEASASSNPIYFYQFAYDGKLGFMKRLMLAKKLPGACHADDLGYLFRLGFWARVLKPDSPEMITLHRMVTMWTNFAKTGNPNSEMDEKFNVTWSPVATPSLEFLHIDNELSMRKEIDSTRIAFWDGLQREKEGIPAKRRT